MIRDKKEIIIFIVVLIIMLAIFFPWIKTHFATDTYNLVNIGYKEAANRSLNDGRAFMYLIGNIAYYLNIPIRLYVAILLILSIIVSTMTMMLLRRIILNYIKENTIGDIITITALSYITIYNFMYIENLYFVECFIMSISIFINIYVAKIMANSEENMHKRAIFLTIISVFMYQGTIGILIAMYLLLLLIQYPSDLKKILKKFLEIVLIIGIAILTNILFVKIISISFNKAQMRMGSVTKIPQNILVIFRFLPIIILQTCGLFPENLLSIFIILISIFTISLCSKTEKRIIINYFTILIITILSGFCTYILSLTSFFTGRLRFSIGALIGILLIYLFCNINKLKNGKQLKKILMFILYIYMIINMINYIIIIDQHIKLNIIEKETILDLGNEIDDYETKNLCKIENVYMVLCDSSDNVYDNQIKVKSVVTYNAIHCSWSASAVINYYLDKNYTGLFLTKQQYDKILEDNQKEDKEFVLIDNSIFVKIYMQ